MILAAMIILYDSYMIFSQIFLYYEVFEEQLKPFGAVETLSHIQSEENQSESPNLLAQNEI